MKAGLGTLYIVATPIGNPRDITLRAIDILSSVDGVICEETRIGSTLLKKINVQSKSLIELNEHNEKKVIPEIIQSLVQSKSLALISDCGTPVFSDPGSSLLEQVVQFQIPVVPIPGPSSLMAALSILAEPMKSFVFGGFLPRQPDERRRHLAHLKNLAIPVILMDTPYRLSALLQDVEKTFGNRQRITLACDLTLKSELIFRGTVHDALLRFAESKKEFILILHDHS